MRSAASQKPDDGALTRIYGARFEPYLPLYWLGLALYKDGKCKDALEQWDKSLRAGAIQRTEKQDRLLRYLEDCRKR